MITNKKTKMMWTALLCMLISMIWAINVRADDTTSKKTYQITLVANASGAAFENGKTAVSFLCPSAETANFAPQYPGTPNIDYGKDMPVESLQPDYWSEEPDGSGEQYDVDLSTLRPHRNMKLYCHWQTVNAKPIDVIFHANGGVYENIDAKTGKITRTYTSIKKSTVNGGLENFPVIPAAPKGKAFENWYKDPACTQKAGDLLDETITSENHEFYAGWTDKNVVTITIDLNGGVWGEDNVNTCLKTSPSGGTMNRLVGDRFYEEPLGYHYGSITREGYKFNGFYLDKACTKSYDAENHFFDELTGNMTLYAGWTKQTYYGSVTINSGKYGYYNPKGDDHSNTVHLTAVTDHDNTRAPWIPDISLETTPKYLNTTIFPNTSEYDFDCYYTEPDGKGDRVESIEQYLQDKDPDFLHVGQDFTFYAAYKKSYVVKWCAGDNAQFTYPVREKDYTYTVKADQQHSYELDSSDFQLKNFDPKKKFIGWYKEDLATGQLTNEKLATSTLPTVTQDITYIAKWSTDENQAVAKVDDSYYSDLSEALDFGARNGSTVVLTKDNGSGNIKSIKNVTVNANGHTFNPDAIKLSADLSKRYDLSWTADSNNSGIYTSKYSPKVTVTAQSTQNGMNSQIASGNEIKALVTNAGPDLLSLNLSVKPSDKSSAPISEYVKKNGYDGSYLLQIELTAARAEGKTTQINETKVPLKIVIQIPNSLKKAGRTFAVLREHNGVVDVLGTGTGDQIAIETDKFSAYSIVYKNGPDDSKTGDGSTPKPAMIPAATGTPTPETTTVPTPAPTENPSASDSEKAEVKAEWKVMYRLYNPNSGEHFYTASLGEKKAVVAAGWQDEGTGWKAPAKSNTPVYRLYNKNGGEHHYTMSLGEKKHLLKVGWTDEGIGWYSDDGKAVPLYRQYNPNAFANNHNYTTSLGEKKHLLQLGWQDEGISWYGVK